MIYIIVYIFLFSLSIVYLIYDKVKNDKLFIFLSFIALIFIAVFRIDTGTDFHAYSNLWKNINIFDSSADSYNYIEIGFRVYISILKFITLSEFIYFAILAIFPLVVFKKAIENLNLNLVIALYFYFTFFYFAYLLNGIGQSFTISLLLLSLKYTYEKNIKIVLIITLFASLFHLSGLFIIIIYLFINSRIPTYGVFIATVVLGLLFYKLALINHMLDYLFPTKFEVYYSFFSNSTSLFQLFTKGGIYILLFAFTYYKINTYNRLFLAYSLGFFIFLSLMGQNMLATKMFMIFKPLEIIMILLLIKYSKNIFTKIAIFSIFAIPYTYQFFVNIKNPDFFYHFRFL